MKEREMAERRERNDEPQWPAHLAEFNPEKWKSKFDWEVARVKWARRQGYRQYKLLPLLQAMARMERSNQDDA
jgi:hypothetical protein